MECRLRVIKVLSQSYGVGIIDRNPLMGTGFLSFLLLYMLPELDLPKFAPQEG
jgi:hypothetical protein